MPVDAGLAQLSQDFLLTTVVLYALAMLAFAGDFAYGRRPAALVAPPPRAATPALARVPAGVGAGAGGVAENQGVAAGPATRGASTAGPAVSPGTGPANGGGVALAGVWGRWRRGGAGPWVRGGLGLMAAGLAAHVAAVATRGLAEHRVPWGNMYEFITAITCATVLAFSVVALRYRVHSLGLFVLTPVVVCLGVAATVLYTAAGPVMPALQSYWLAIHVTSMVLAIGGYLVAAVMTVLFLVTDTASRRAGVPGAAASGLDPLLRRLPSVAALDRLSYRVVMFAFPVWTFGVIAGAIWADQTWGRYWGWDPKETWSFITWVVYACYLHARSTSGWRGRRAAYVQLAGFTCLLFNVVGVNLWITGLHTYAGIS